MTVSALRPEHRALRFALWPATDRAAWEDALRPADFLDEGGGGATWRPASRRACQGAYGRLLAWLKARGVDLEGEAPTARITRDRMRAYAAFLGEGRSSVTVASAFGVLCMVLIALFPEHDWNWLRAIQSRMKQRASATRGKEERLVPAAELLRLGLDLIASATEVLDMPADPGHDEADRRRRASAVRDFRDGLMIALLASRPLRVINLLMTRIGSHLRQSGSHITLHYAAAETKTHRAHDTVWPEALVPALRRYLSEVRPLLAAAPSLSSRSESPGAYLWLAQGGTPMTEAALYNAVRKHTNRRFGHPITAHLFRDWAATTIANEAPIHVRDAAQLLGHSTIRTTERNYIAASSAGALAHHHDLIASMRAGSRKRGSRATSERAHQKKGLPSGFCSPDGADQP